MSTRLVRSGLMLALLALVAACGGVQSLSDAGADGSAGPIRVYTSVTEETVEAVTAAYGERHAGAQVEVFRAPTGELNARIAAERREGRIQADVVWLTDPLSMQQYDAEGLLRTWTPREASVVPAEFKTDTFWGTRILDMVIVHRTGLDPVPTRWRNLTDPAYGAVAFPDPGFAGSAFGALGYFALAEDYGFAYYRDLANRGGVQVQSPGDVVTGVAEGRFDAGMTLGFTARQAIEKGSPIELVWPESGAIAMYSPIAVLSAVDDPAAAESFVNFVLTEPAQEAIAETGWQPVRDDVAWPHNGPQVTPDWSAAFDRQEELLEAYRTIFGD